MDDDDGWSGFFVKDGDGLGTIGEAMVGDGLFTTDVTGFGEGLIGRVEGGLFTTGSDLLTRNEEIDDWVCLIDGIDSVFGVVLLEF